MATDETIGPEPEPGGCYHPVLLDAVRRVARAEAAIQRREHAAADPAPAGEEGVTYARIRPGKFGKRTQCNQHRVISMAVSLSLDRHRPGAG